jgi:hypothetical protein
MTDVHNCTQLLLVELGSSELLLAQIVLKLRSS